MTYGLSKEQYDYLRGVLVEPIEKRQGKVWCFGSRARGEHNAFSDVDLLVESDTDLSALLGSIAEVLENSNFPYKVDIVSEADLADSYRHSVEKDKLVF